MKDLQGDSHSVPLEQSGGNSLFSLLGGKEGGSRERREREKREKESEGVGARVSEERG